MRHEYATHVSPRRVTGGYCIAHTVTQKYLRGWVISGRIVCMNIPKEAVETAVKAHIGPGDTVWDDLTPMVRRVRIRKMQKALEAAAPHMQAGAVEACDAELDLHLIIKGLRVRNGSAAGMMVCSSEDRAQIVQAILAAGYQKAAK